MDRLAINGGAVPHNKGVTMTLFDTKTHTRIAEIRKKIKHYNKKLKSIEAQYNRPGYWSTHNELDGNQDNIEAVISDLYYELINLKE